MSTQLRGDPKTKDVPVVVLTSKEMTTEDKRRLNGRISYVASKAQFDSAGLVALVRRLTAEEAVR